MCVGVDVGVCNSGSDTFVEVGMPRSPSHSGNSSELKQMLASCKTASGKRQAVELLQGTKNSHLQYVLTSTHTQSELLKTLHVKHWLCATHSNHWIMEHIVTNVMVSKKTFY